MDPSNYYDGRISDNDQYHNNNVAWDAWTNQNNFSIEGEGGTSRFNFSTLVSDQFQHLSIEGSCSTSTGMGHGWFHSSFTDPVTRDPGIEGNLGQPNFGQTWGTNQFDQGIQGISGEPNAAQTWGDYQFTQSNQWEAGGGSSYTNDRNDENTPWGSDYINPFDEGGYVSPQPNDDHNENEDDGESDDSFQLDDDAIINYCLTDEHELFNYYWLCFGGDYQPRKAPIPYHTSEETGYKWVSDILSCPNPARCYNNFSMNRVTFMALCRDLTFKYGWVTKRARNNMVTVMEALAMFISSLRGMTLQQIDERCNRGKGTVSKTIMKILGPLDRMAKEYIAPVEGHQTREHPYLKKRVMYQYFKDCIGAIDGTHVPTSPPVKDKIKFFGRKGGYTMNILAVADFDLCFTYASTGWEGSMHDYNVFKKTIYGKNSKSFPHPNLENGKYYLVDSGYPNKRGYLAPYKGYKYHQEDFRRGNRRIKGSYELFNRWHAGLRACVERTFGVWKKRFRMMKNDCPFSFEKQRYIVTASMGIHNYIRRHDRNDPIFSEAEREDVDYVYEHETNVDASVDPDESAIEHESGSDAVMDNFRDHLRMQIAERERQERARGNRRRM